MASAERRAEARPLYDKSTYDPEIVKKSIDECVLKCVGQMPVTAEKPLNLES
jgi:hypothetical protein